VAIIMYALIILSISARRARELAVASYFPARPAGRKLLAPWPATRNLSAGKLPKGKNDFILAWQ
jgi:hypothetical protein